MCAEWSGHVVISVQVSLDGEAVMALAMANSVTLPPANLPNLASMIAVVIEPSLIMACVK